MSNVRLNVVAEGHTEQLFVKNVLCKHLVEHHILCNARCVMTSRDKKAAKYYRGGLLDYTKAKQDIVTWLKEDNHSDCYLTTMFDLYALPNDFPGYDEAQKKVDPYQKVEVLENALGNDINNRRFIPYIQLHEFEALILAAPEHLGYEYLEHDKQIARLAEMVGKQNPELINDGYETAPSKRILKEIKEYDKVTSGVSVVEVIGINFLKEKCIHFADWISKLENLGADI